MEVKATNKYKYCIYASLSRFGHLNRDDVGVKTCAINLACIAYYIYAYHDFWKKLRCSYNSVHTLARTGTDAGSEAMHTRMYACFDGGHIESLYQSS